MVPMIFADAQPVKAKAAGLNVSEVAMRTVSMAANGYGFMPFKFYL